MITQTTFTPQKKTSRLYFLLGVASKVAIFAGIYYFDRFIHPDTQYSSIRIVILALCPLAVVLIFRAKIVNSITVDLGKKELVVSYVTILKNECTRVIPFPDITYEYKLIEGQQEEFTILHISVNYKKEFSVREGDLGWSRETLENLHAKLESSSIY